MKKTFLVTLEIPEGVTTEQMREYIRESVAVWKGRLDADDPLFDLDASTVEVTAE